MAASVRRIAGLHAIEPLGYRDFVTLARDCTLVATDSGGIQEETTVMGVPCLTMREGTERPITVEEGTNIIVGLDPLRVGQAVDEILAGRGKKGRIPAGWDGNAAARIVDAIERMLGGFPVPRTNKPI
jgi:UDP-N-acetylglucosamine 2-epimerase (non-hydrolysing)